MPSSKPLALALATLLLTAAPAGRAASERQSLEELRNTVVNLLQTLVDQHVMTGEQASRLVQQAQEKAARDLADAGKRDEGAVRVPYVPQIVKDEISRQVAADVEPRVVSDVVATAKSERWGVPGALPAWLGHVRVDGDVRVRFQEDLFGHGNLAATVPDYNAINAAGGITKAGAGAFLDSTDDRQRLRLRARLGAEVTLSDSFSAGIRLSTGGATDPSSESQTFGTTAARYTIGLDQGYIRYEPRARSDLAPLTTVGGRLPSPWFNPTELVFARDLSFEGVAATFRAPLSPAQGGGRSHAFATLGAFPIQEVPLAHQNNKWLAGAQFGVDWRMASEDRLRIGAAYYDFIHVTGQPNPPGLSLYNYTAPPFVRYGNTYFDIQDSLDGSSNLFALAARFRLVNLSAAYDHQFSRYRLTLIADAVRNVGYSAADMYARSGIQQEARTRGYVLDASYGDPDAAAGRGFWKAAFGYRYVQRDAVLDAWTDADFHGGGTNARGFYFVADLGLAENVWLRLRYMGADAIDGPPPYTLDVLQLDLNTRF